MNRTLTIAVTALALATGSVAVSSAGPLDEERRLALEREAADLVRQIADAGDAIRDDAERLADVKWQPAVTRETHGEILGRIRDAMNGQVRPALVRLDAMKEELPGWKQRGIDEIVQATRLLAVHTSHAFEAKRDQPLGPPLMVGPYRAHVVSIQRYTGDLARTSDAAATYVTARLRALDVGLAVPTI